MKKSSVIERPEKQIPARVPPTMIRLIQTRRLGDLTRVRSELKSIDRSIGQYKRETAGAIERRKETQTVESELAKREKIIIEETKTDAGRMLAALKKHVGVQSIESNGDGIITIETPLLFTDIREEAGARVSKRACLGAFRICINPNRPTDMYAIRVTNLIFDPRNVGYGHWGVRGGRPCLGEWAAGIVPALTRCDYYDVFDTMYHYLKEAELDGSAYLRAQNWRDHYRNVQIRDTRGVSTDDYVIGIHDEPGKRLRGLVGRIIYDMGESVSVEFRRDIGGHEGYVGEGEDGHCWDVQKTKISPITKELYDGAERYPIKVSTIESDVRTLDKLPDGTSYAEAVDALGVKCAIELSLETILKHG